MAQLTFLDVRLFTYKTYLSQTGLMRFAEFDPTLLSLLAQCPRISPVLEHKSCVFIFSYKLSM